MFPKITAEESGAVSPDSVGHGSSFSKPAGSLEEQRCSAEWKYRAVLAFPKLWVPNVTVTNSADFELIHL